MEIGIIAEGKGDCAVLQNIIMGILDVDEEDIRFLRPEFSTDNTDKTTYTNMSANQFGSWTLVKKDCEEQFKINNFLNSPIAEERYIVIQIDTAECEETGYDVIRPDKENPEYCTLLRNNVLHQISNWLGNQWQDKIHYAICIEEMEAWIHTLYEDKDTSIPLQAKEAFQKYLTKRQKKDKKFTKKFQRLKQKPEYDKSLFLSKDFQKLQSKKIKKVVERNVSLKTFILSLERLKVASS